MWHFLIILLVIVTQPSLQKVYHYVDPEEPEVFEFGVKKGSEVFASSGRIGSSEMEHLKIIPIQIYDCYVLTYVKVEVTNRNTPPAVSVDFNEKMVFIRYRHAQYSASTYKIVAYGVKDEDFCETL